MEIFNLILSYVLLYKYTALFAFTFAGAFIAPVPTTTVLVAASAFASQGYFNFYLVIGVALAGNIAGDNLGYFLAHRYGRRLLLRIGFGRILRSDKYQLVEDYIVSHPGALIYFSRFLTGLDPAVNILAGLSNIPYRTYLGYDLWGEFSYVLLYAFIGFLLGGQWENNLTFLAKFGLIMLVLGGITVTIQSAVFYRKRRRGTRQS